ncbi:hypothetical protein ABFS83_08G209900 [Erythranthe nasuta]
MHRIPCCSTNTEVAFRNFSSLPLPPKHTAIPPFFSTNTLSPATFHRRIPPELQQMDSFLLNYDAAEVRIAAEFLSNWLPYLSRGLCESCTTTLSNGIESLHTGDFAVSTPNLINRSQTKEDQSNCSPHPASSTKDSAANKADGAPTLFFGEFAVSSLNFIDLNRRKEDQGNCSSHSGENTKDIEDNSDDADVCSLGSWKDEAYAEASSSDVVSSSFATPIPKKSWADMALEDELAAEEEENEVSSGKLVNTKDSGASVNGTKSALSRDQREYIRFNNVQRKKDFICLERVDGKLVNILEGLELHKGVFSAAEQKRIVSYVENLQEMGKKGQLKDRTYSAPVKWMRGKGRVTLQFGCCYNYALDRQGNPPGILKNGTVDPLPDLFKVMIRRLVRWNVLPPTCVPDSCIVNIYEKDDCIPPHIDNHDFVRPFCTVSFLSECEILFGSKLTSVRAGEFTGSFAIALPVGSVLVINGNGADVAKHCVPAVPSRRISITFRKMDESKQPNGYVAEPDLQGLEPFSDGADTNSSTRSNKNASTRPVHTPLQRPAFEREDRVDKGRGIIAERPDSRYSSRARQGPVNRRRF